MDSELIVTRRDWVEQVLRAAAVPGAAAFFASFSRARDHNHQGAAAPQTELLSDYRPRFFSADDFQALEAFAEILIPSDDTPGAREARCAQFIDFVLHASDESQQTHWRTAMELLKRTGFYKASPKRRIEIVTEMSRFETNRAARHPAFPAYRLIKQQTVFAFYTSRQGMIEALDYKGNSYNAVFPPCNHPEHQAV